MMKIGLNIKDGNNFYIGVDWLFVYSNTILLELQTLLSQPFFSSPNKSSVSHFLYKRTLLIWPDFPWPICDWINRVWRFEKWLCKMCYMACSNEQWTIYKAYMKSITIFFSKMSTTGCLDTHLAKSLVRLYIKLWQTAILVALMFI